MDVCKGAAVSKLRCGYFAVRDAMGDPLMPEPRALIMPPLPDGYVNMRQYAEHNKIALSKVKSWIALSKIDYLRIGSWLFVHKDAKPKGRLQPWSRNLCLKRAKDKREAKKNV